MRLETDAAGELRAVVNAAVAASRRRIPIGHAVDRVEVWRADPRCAHCGEVIADVAECALVLSTSKHLPPRVAHQTKQDANGDYCFAQAIMAVNPLYSARAARAREDAQ